MSVGGAYAVALAARHPDRVAALGVVASPVETRTAMGPVEAMVEQARPEFAAWVATVHAADPDDDALAARFLASLPAADADLLAAALAPAEVAASVREALAQHDGYLRDAALLFGDWGVRFEDITRTHPPLVRRPRRPQPTRERCLVVRPDPGRRARRHARHDPPGHPARELAGDPRHARRHLPT